VKRILKSRLAVALSSVMIVLAMVMPMMATPAAAAGPRHSHMHPGLEQTAKNQPKQNVRVIVEGKNGSGELDKKIAGKGGVKKNSLGMIKGVAAEMSAQAAQELANDPDVQWVTFDSPMAPTYTADQLTTVYPVAVGADQLWTGQTPYTGQGVTVAVLDSGIKADLKDFRNINTGKSRVVASPKFVNAKPDSNPPNDGDDKYGHGTHVAGIIASNGSLLYSKYVGIAPEANLVSLKVANDQGVTYTSDVIYALQWLLMNRDKYNVRVLNMSLVQQMPESYLTSPLDAMAELCWLSGITVVVSAGNLGPDSALYAPANDPLVITVGASDTKGTRDISDDSIPSWSSYGTTQDGFNKPEVVAPGRCIISDVSRPDSYLARMMPDRITDWKYMRLSGTSMSAPVVSGIVALTLQAHPGWTPDQVKGALIATARQLSSPGDGAGLVNAAATVAAQPTFANQGITLNMGVAGLAGTTTFNATTWNATTWNATTWNATTWNATTWNATTWNATTWNATTWNATTWNATTWNSVPFPD
jgi:serine protease AprX